MKDMEKGVMESFLKPLLPWSDLRLGTSPQEELKMYLELKKLLSELEIHMKSSDAVQTLLSQKEEELKALLSLSTKEVKSKSQVQQDLPDEGDISSDDFEDEDEDGDEERPLRDPSDPKNDILAVLQSKGRMEMKPLLQSVVECRKAMGLTHVGVPELALHLKALRASKEIRMSKSGGKTMVLKGGEA